tara:strand:+ start:5548 stop:7641 length:2094 start_codon:yes stop_codon:yes gene_type:complete
MTSNSKANITCAKNSINARGELMLYGEIGDWFDGLDALSIVTQLEAIDSDEIVVRIHSGGGSVMEGIAMYNRLKQSPKRVIVYVDGIAASMAAFIAMAGDLIYMPENALMMFHKPWLTAGGNADELRKTADNLDILEQSLAMMVADKTGMTAEAVMAMLQPGDDIWMNGAEAVEKGFADQLMLPIQAVASIEMGSLNPPAEKFNDLFLTHNAAPLASKKPLEKDLMTHKQMNEGAGGSEAELAVAATTTDAKIAIKPDLKKEALVDSVAAVDPKAAFDALMKDERARKSSIEQIGANASLTATEIAAMIDTGISINDARAATLDILTARDAGSQPKTTVIRTVAGDSSGLRSAMASAMLNRADPVNYKLDGAAAEFRGMSMLEMARSMIDYSGSNTRGLSRQELAAKALHSSSDFPLIIADVSNKMLRNAYEETPRTFLPIATQTSSMNFKSKHSMQLGNGEGLEKVNESGEYKYGTVSESDETYKVETFGRIFSFTRQLIINDDLGALMQFISRIGNLAARKESDIVWDLVKSNPLLSDGIAAFSTNAKRKNLGVGGAIDEAGISGLRKLMRQQKGLDGEYINVSPSYLVVNSERETEAQKILSAVLAATTGDVNIFQNSLQLIVEERITDTNNPWYAFSAPASQPAIEFAYLDGQSGPTIETENGFDVDGVKIKISHDFGAGWVDHRGAAKNPGV